MKRISFLVAVFLIQGCLQETVTPTSKLMLNANFVNFCEREVGEPFTWNNLMLSNTGKGPLTVKSILVRGDEGCAFECYLRSDGNKDLVRCPDEGAGAKEQMVTLLGGEAMLVRLVYTPSAEGDTDRATLVINTDADNYSGEAKNGFAQVLVPICGAGAAESVDSDGEEIATDDLDGGASDLDGGASDVDGGDQGCGDCGEPQKKGAPGCESRD